MDKRMRTTVSSDSGESHIYVAEYFRTLPQRFSFADKVIMLAMALLVPYAVIYHGITGDWTLMISSITIGIWFFMWVAEKARRGLTEDFALYLQTVLKTVESRISEDKRMLEETEEK